MPDSPSFDDLLRRIRTGDKRAAAELVRAYEPIIRDAVRRRLVNAGLVRVLDSMDISQSVLGSFFQHAKDGQYDLDTPEQLVKLLVTMAHNKLVSQARKHHAARRNIRRNIGALSDDSGLVDSNPTPSRQAATNELFHEIQRRLSPEEQELAKLRHDGHDWATIAAKLGGTAQARRRQLKRALDRVATELDLEEADDA